MRSRLARIDAASPPPVARVAGRVDGTCGSSPVRAGAFLAAAALSGILAGLGASTGPAAAQAPRTQPGHAIRVGAALPLRELLHDTLRVVSLGAAPAFGVALLPARGPLQRVLLDAAPAMLRVDPGDRCTQLNGFDCGSETVYGFTASAAAETGVRTSLGRRLLGYATLGPALRLYAFRTDFACIPEAIVCTTASHYGGGGIGVGAHAAVGLRRTTAGRHLATEAAATLVTYPGARAQLDLGATVAFPF